MQVEALDGDGGDEDMTAAADERPSKRRKGGGSTRAPVPEQHRSGARSLLRLTRPQLNRITQVCRRGRPDGRPDGRKSKACPSASVREGWRRFAADLAVAERAAAAAEGGFAFAFVEGALVKAVREGALAAAGRGRPRARPLLESNTIYMSLTMTLPVAVVLTASPCVGPRILPAGMRHAPVLSA